MSETEVETVEEQEASDAEQADEPPAPEDAPVEEPDQAAPDAAEAMAQAMPAADEADPRIVESQKKWESFQKALVKIWGDYSSNFQECPLCFSSHKGLLDMNDAGQYPEEMVTFVTTFARGAQQVTLREDPNTEECSTCGGNGKTLTKGHVPNHTEKQCDRCKGYGYLPPPVPTGNGTAPAAVQATQPGEENPDAPKEDVDIWGSPRLLPSGAENPNYGKMPQYKIAGMP